MLELLFTAYILSGPLKSILYAFGLPFPLDFTLSTALATILYMALTRNVSFSELTRNLFTYSWLLVLFLWSAVTLCYSLSHSYGYFKVLLFVTNLIAYYVPVTAQRFDYRRFYRCFVSLTLFIALIYFLFNPDIELYLMPRHWLNYSMLESLGLSVGELLGIALFIIFFTDITSNKWLPANIALILLGATGARFPILAFLPCVIVTGLIVIYTRHRSLTQSLKHIISLLATFAKSRAMVYIIVFNAAFIGLYSNSEYVRAMYARTQYRIMLLYDYKVDMQTITKYDAKPTQDITRQHEHFEDVFDALLAMKKKDGRSFGALQELAPDDLQSDRNRSVNVRVNHLQFCYDALSASALRLLFGYGMGAYGVIKEGREGRLYPHNIVLEAWIELGLVGVVILCGMMFSVMKTIPAGNAALSATVIFLILNLLKSSSLVDLRVFFAFVALLQLWSNTHKQANMDL